MSGCEIFPRRLASTGRLYGAAALSRFQTASVCVVGIGGVGSWAAEALARTGIGKLILIDLDNIAESNTNRQIHALTPDWGKPKVDAMAQRIALINPDCAVRAVDDFLSTDNMADLLDGADFVIDAIDDVRVKSAMAAFLVRRKIPFILSGAAGGKRRADTVTCADLADVTNDRLLARVRYHLRRNENFPRQKKMRVPCIYSTETAMPHSGSGGLACAGYGSSVVVTASFGMAAAAAALETLCLQAA